VLSAFCASYITQKLSKSSLLKATVDAMAPLLAQLANLSFTTGVFPTRYKLGHVADIHSWCRSRRLQLNPSITELIWLGFWTNLSKIDTENLAMQVDNNIIHPAKTVRDLGVTLNNELSMQRHVNKVASAMLPPHSSVEASPPSAWARCHNKASFYIHTEQTGLL